MTDQRYCTSRNILQGYSDLSNFFLAYNKAKHSKLFSDSESVKHWLLNVAETFSPENWHMKA
jgi:hypothetical protein